MLIDYDLDYMSFHQGIIHVLLSKVLGKYMNDYKTDDYYPVVLGGQNVIRCAKRTRSSGDLMKEIFSSDIDIDFIIMKPIVNNEDPIVTEVHHRRIDFIQKILKDQDLARYINKLIYQGADVGLYINLRVDDTMMQLPADHEASSAMVLRIRADYYMGNDFKYSIVLLDTGLFSTFSRKEMFYDYQKFFRDPLNRPVPTMSYGGVIYATCGHAFYDTARMLDWYSHSLDTIKSTRRLQTIFVKYANLIAKFTALYVLINDLKDDEKYRELYEIYKSVREILIQIDAQNMFANKITDTHKQQLINLLNILKGKTDFNSLINIAQQVNGQKTPIGMHNKQFKKGGARSLKLKHLHNQLHTVFKFV